MQDSSQYILLILQNDGTILDNVCSAVKTEAIKAIRELSGMNRKDFAKWLIMAILIYMATHQQWQELVIAFCIGFASYLAANAVLGLEFMCECDNIVLHINPSSL